MNDLISRKGLLVVPHVRKVSEYDESGEHITFNAVSEDDIKNAPAVDAVPVVRCTKCVHSIRSPFGHPHLRWCKLEGELRDPDHYCAYGQPRRERE